MHEEHNWTTSYHSYPKKIAWCHPLGVLLILGYWFLSKAQVLWNLSVQHPAERRICTATSRRSKFIYQIAGSEKTYNSFWHTLIGYLEDQLVHSHTHLEYNLRFARRFWRSCIHKKAQWAILARPALLTIKCTSNF